MGSLKPIQSSVCTDLSVWNSMCKIAVTKPTKEQINKAKQRSQKFSKVVKN